MWRWDGSTWTLIDAEPHPVDCSTTPMSLGANDRLAVVRARRQPLGETWEWMRSRRPGRSASLPMRRRAGAHHRMVFDEARGVHRAVRTGGRHWRQRRDLGWNGTDWTQRMFAVKPLRASIPRWPTTRAATARAVRGQAGAGGTTLGDTGSTNGSAWTQRTPVHSPSPRRRSDDVRCRSCRRRHVWRSIRPWTPSPLFLPRPGVEWHRMGQRATVATPMASPKRRWPTITRAPGRPVRGRRRAGSGPGHVAVRAAESGQRLSPEAAVALAGNGVPSLGPAPYSLRGWATISAAAVSGVPAGSGRLPGGRRVGDTAGESRLPGPRRLQLVHHCRNRGVRPRQRRHREWGLTLPLVRACSASDPPAGAGARRPGARRRRGQQCPPADGRRTLRRTAGRDPASSHRAAACCDGRRAAKVQTTFLPGRIRVPPGRGTACCHSAGDRHRSGKTVHPASTRPCPAEPRAPRPGRTACRSASSLLLVHAEVHSAHVDRAAVFADPALRARLRSCCRRSHDQRGAARRSRRSNTR